MKWTWIVVLLVVFLYIHLFNRIATLYFESDRQLTLRDLYRRFVPPAVIQISI
jgi:hypothetical protein